MKTRKKPEYWTNEGKAVFILEQTIKSYFLLERTAVTKSSASERLNDLGINIFSVLLGLTERARERRVDALAVEKSALS